MYVRITTQNAQIGIETTRGRLDIRQNRLPMELTTKQPSLKLNIEAPVLYIDQQRCFSEAGLKNNMELTKKYAQRGKQAALQATAKAARDGRELSNIQVKGSAIARQAKRESATFDEQQFNFDMIPKSRPEITVTPGEVRGELKEGSIDIQLNDYRPEINYQRGDVKIYLKQKNYISFEYVGNGIDAFGG
jgi:hypothetical protein